eukprot:1161756-Pelagomonas_calceolata.AAC.1
MLFMRSAHDDASCARATHDDAYAEAALMLHYVREVTIRRGAHMMNDAYTALAGLGPSLRARVIVTFINEQGLRGPDEAVLSLCGHELNPLSVPIPSFVAKPSAIDQHKLCRSMRSPSSKQ